jgi:hypothetical protein
MSGTGAPNSFHPALIPQYIRAMRSLCLTLAAASLFLGSTPALAGASGFNLVNGTGANITALSIRRFGTQAWQPLSATASAGARTQVNFSNVDCAFDIRATLAGGSSAVWSGVNLCEVKSVTLNRNAATGENWVDYD